MSMYFKSIVTALVGLCALSSAADAAIAPNYQRAKEMTAVIEAVAKLVPAHPITKVIYQKRHQYRVIAGPCSIRAMIVTEPQRNPTLGAQQFDVTLVPQRCGK
jgi:calcineurin-like phosphoesterase